ncbi:hypothetical protein GCM10009527_087950 [Actinomadura nitritigenes]
MGWEVSALLRSEAVVHAINAGDFMGQAHPAPEGDPQRAEISEMYLTAVWANFAQRGYRRLIYEHHERCAGGGGHVRACHGGWSADRTRPAHRLR